MINTEVFSPEFSQEKNKQFIRDMEQGRSFKGGTRHAEEVVWKNEEAKDAYDQLVLDNARLVIKVYQKFFSSTFQEEDEKTYISAGLEGLVKAVILYDSSKGELSTYCCTVIKNSIIDEINRQRLLKTTTDLDRYAKKIDQAFGILFQKNRREPTLKELSETTGLSVSLVEMTLTAKKRPYSLNKEQLSCEGDDFDEWIQNIPSTENLSPEDVLIMKEDFLQKKQNIEWILKKISSNYYLTKREKAVLQLRYLSLLGTDFEQPTQSKVAKMFGVSEERVSQIERSALRKITEG